MTDSTGDVWTSQLRIVSGDAVEDAPQIAFAERRDSRGRLVRLYLLAEPAAAGGEAFIDGFVTRVGEAFDPAKRSLTGALAEAIEGRHQELREWNREHLPAQQAAYGLSAALLREGESGILCQAGPSLTVLAGDPPPGALRELHVRGRQGDDPSAQPIGGSGALRIQFFPMPAARDGWALLLTSNAQRLLDAGARTTIRQLAVDQVLPNLYPALRDLNRTAALIISLPPTQSPNQPPGRPAAPPPDQPAAAQTPPEPSIAEPPPKLEREPIRIDTDPLDQPAQAAAADQPPPVEPPQPKPEPPRRADAGRELTFEAPPEPHSAWPTNPFAAVELSTLAAGATANAGAPPSWSRAIAELSGNLPSPAARRPKLERQRSRLPPLRTALIAFTAMALILAAAAVALLAPALLSRGDQQFSARLEGARQGLAAAALGVDVPAARQSLRAALGDVNLALEDKPLDQQALDLRVEIEAALAELDLLSVPTEFETLVDLGRFGPGIAVGAIYLADNQADVRLYALDDAGGRIFAISPTGVATEIFSENTPLSQMGTQKTARPISLALGGNALWVLDAEQQLFRLDPAGALLIDIPQSARLGSLNAIAVAGGALWLLDAAGGAVWRFPLAESGALDSPTRWIPRTDLAGGVEIAVAPRTNGTIELFVAMSDGRLRRFIDGEEHPLTLQGLDREPLAPASLTIGQSSGMLYLTDRGNNRVLIFSPDGALSRQIAAEQLAGLRGVAVEEARSQIIYALPTRLIASPLPAASDQGGG